MKFAISLILVLAVSSSAKANILDGIFRYAQSYACLGLDGVPIPHETELASKCCNGGSLSSSDPTCRSSIITNTAGPATTAGQGVTLANNVIHSTQNLHGNSTDYDTQIPLTHDNSVNHGAGSAAMTAGGTISDSVKGSGAGSSSGATADNKGSAAGSKSGAGSSGGGGSAGLSMGTASGTTGLSGANVAALSKDKDSAGGYVGGGKKGDGGYGSGGMGFGSLGGGKDAGMGDAGKDYDLGENGKDGKDGLASGNGSSGDDDGKGSSEDPSDYFNRTNKTDNIFKIVSARYLKKKSLWSIPQKQPEDLKLKKI